MKAIMTVGVSASGKSSYARMWVDESPSTRVEINRDLVRADILGGELVWKNWKWKWEKFVTKTCDAQLGVAISEGKDVIISDTNLNEKYRDQLVERLKSVGYDVELKMFPIDFKEAVRRDNARKNGVGHSVIAKQFDQWNDQFETRYRPDKSLPKAIIVDVDGTLAEMSGRSPYEWHRVCEDTPKQLTIDVVNSLKDSLGYQVIVVSGRDGICYEDTVKWLEFHGVQYDEFYMRKEGDTRKDTVIKSEIFWTHLHDRFNIVGVLDDRPSVVRMWRSLGIETVAFGNQLIEF